MPFTLPHLPTELLEMIAIALAGDFAQAYSEEGKVICALRSTCREVRDKLDTKFFSTYFTSRYLWLEERKLAELDIISQRPDLAQRVTELSVICNADPEGLGDVFEAGRSLIAPGGLARTLAASLGRLENLDSLEFTDASSDKPPPPGNGHDVSSTFTAVMLALEPCKCNLKSLLFHSHTKQASEWRIVGMPDPRTLLCLAPSLLMLERLDLSIFCAPILTNKVLSGTKIGSELAVALGRCTQLKELSLRMLFTTEASEAFDTLQECHLGSLSIAGDDRTAIPDLLSVLQEKLRLKRVTLSRLNTKHETFVFSGMGKTMWWDTSGEEEWITVFHSDEYVELDGYDEVQDGLAQARKCVTYVPRH
ncbi:hypothetical protein LTS12_013230 [Elasticomyces elasticus]|nr:hypothetical protein LTS12_013230 [Elasticomyces elasticus]